MTMTLRFELVIVDSLAALVVVVLVVAHCGHINSHPNYDVFLYIDGFNRFYLRPGYSKLGLGRYGGWPSKVIISVFNKSPSQKMNLIVEPDFDKLCD